MILTDFIKHVLHFPRRVIRKHKKNKEYIEYVCQASGWTMAETKKAMKKASREGISYKYYAKKRLWARSEKEMAAVRKNASAARTRNLEETEHAIQEVMKATGWSRLAAEEKMIEARRNCGSSFKDYYRFRMYELTPDERRDYFTLGVFERLSFKYNPDPAALKILLRKDKFAKKFDDLFGRIWLINRDLSFEDFCAKCEGLDELFCKPLSSTQGKGIVRIRFSDYPDMKSAYEDLMSKKKMICEECIIQHPAIAAFNSSSVNTVRVLTIVDSKDGEAECHHVYAGFRMGRGKSVDNFHSGGIIASVDTATGITCMDAIDLAGNHYPIHPLSGLNTEGFQLPNWDKVLEITEKAALRLASLKTGGAGMVGWDVAITQEGACLVEGNSEPSHTIIQLPFVQSRKGMRYLVEDFLD